MYTVVSTTRLPLTYLQQVLAHLGHNQGVQHTAAGCIEVFTYVNV